MKISAREKNILWVTVAVAFILFNYLFVWEWLGSVIDRGRQVHSLRSEAVLRKETITRIPEWEAEIKSLRARTDSGGKIEVDTDWLRRLEATAKKSGLSVNSQRPIPEKETPFGTESGVNFSIEASQEALVKFLHELQADAANPQVQVLQITPKNPGIDQLHVETTIMVVRFTL
jgi:type II secretory pathway component PulM